MRKTRRWTVNLTLLLSITLLVLLPLLAFLQHRWLGQISEAEHQKMLESLKNDTDHFCGSFDLEVTRAFLTFAIGRGSTGEEKNREYDLDYRRWRETSKHPTLVKALYDIEVRGGSWVTSRFDLESKRLEAADWPASLEQVHDNLVGFFDRGWSPPQVASPDAGAVAAMPALIVPRSTPVRQGQGGEGFAPITRAIESNIASDKDSSEMAPEPKGMVIAPQSDISEGFTIVIFDEKDLTEDFIPRLAERFFGSQSSSAYEITIVQPVPLQVLYQSEPRKDHDATGDVVENLFGVRLDELPDVFAGDQTKPQGLATTTIVRSTQFLALGNNPGTGTSSRAEDRLVAEATPKGVWQAVVRHKAGSLEAAVAATRRKNLTISFGVLILLAGSFVIMIASTHTAKRLARQQVEFVAGISHEFRTPLAVICSAGENLADGVIDSAAQVKKYGSLIEAEGKKLTAMVEQVLQFAGVQSGRQSPAPRPVAAGAVIDRALAACDRLIADGHFVVDKRIDPSLPPILGDPDTLERSIQNLLGNAIKYAGRERWIGVIAEKASTPAEIRITIQDRGMGIPADELPIIFKPFYRGRQAVAEQIHGNGLGLSLVKHFVEAAGGRVTVTSTSEHGSAFTLHLPVATDGAGDATRSMGVRNAVLGRRGWFINGRWRRRGV